MGEMRLYSPGRHHFRSSARLCTESRMAWISIFIFVVCTLYLYYCLAEHSSVIVSLDDGNGRLKRARSAVISANVALGNGTVDRPHVPNFLRTSTILSRMEFDMRCTMMSRLQRARTYLATVHEEFDSARAFLTDPVQHGRFLTYRPHKGGLGNFMFVFATLVGCARMNNRIPVRMTNEPRMELFEGMDIGFVDQSALFPDQATARFTVGEAGPGMFTPRFHEINTYFPNQAIALTGYGQSWKYFHNFSAEIRSMLTFTKPIQVAAVDAIMYGMNQLYKRGLFINICATPLRVGIHVRRGDIVHNADQRRHGHVAASEEYLLRAVFRVERKYQHVVFFVMSNDMDYCQRLFREDNFVFLNGYAEVVMAVMTFMEVMVLSVGSFGWWGAYLGDAREVYYYKDWPRPGSDYQKGVTAEDYFPPHWHGEN